MTEHTLQLNIIAYFRNEFERHEKGVIIPIVNEATYKNKTFVICKGASDLMIFLKNKTFFCELKVANNNQSIAQKDFQNRVQKLGHEYKLIRSLDEFKLWIQSLTTNN